MTKKEFFAKSQIMRYCDVAELAQGLGLQTAQLWNAARIFHCDTNNDVFTTERIIFRVLCKYYPNKVKLAIYGE